jgi:two-component system sensor histidine kinase ChiS
MIKFTKSICWICVLLLFQPIHLFPQQPDFKFEHLTSADGLLSNTNMHVFQDHLGFLWIANWNGLVRYDGYKFKTYQPDSTNPYSINARKIVRTDEDSEGNLWISTHYKGINKYDRKTGQFFHYTNDPQDSTSLSSNEIFKCYLDRSDLLWIVHQNGLLDKLDTKTGIITRCRHNPNDTSTISHNFITTWRVSRLRLAALHEDKKGDIWIGTRGGGLNRYDKNTNSFTSYKHDPNDPNSISSDTVTCIYEDSENSLWISTWGGGLNRYLRETNTFNHYRHNSKDKNTLANDYCLHILEDESNNLWLSVRNGLDLFNRKEKTFTHYKHDPKNPYSLSRELFAIPLYEDKSGLMWFLIGGGDYLSVSTFDVFNPQKGKFFHIEDDVNNPQGLRGFGINSLYKDHSGNVWICTDNRGINKLNPLRQNIIHHHHEPKNTNSLCHNSCYAILESTSQPDIIWIGTKNGLDKYNQRTGMFTHLVNNWVSSICEDRFGRLWITAGGLSCYDIKRAQFTNYTHNPQDSTSLSTNSLWSICEDHFGTLWLGSIDRGLIRYQRENDSFTNYVHNPADSQTITPGYVWCIYEDREGILWIGTEHGLNKFNRDNQTFTHYLTDKSIFVIHEDKHNNFWLATRWDGLCLFNRQTGEANFYDQKQGLCNNRINSIVEDDDGFLWLGTEGGLSKFNPKTGEFTNFSEEHGFPTELFHVNGTKLKNGQIWLTTIDNGIVGFYPDQVKINTIPPKIVLTDIKLFNKSLKVGSDLPLKQGISITKEITFAHWQNDITFECAALHFSCPKKNQYAFWLENYDKDWYYTGTNRIASYTNLHPGEYIFHAKGSNSDNVWNEEGTSIAVIITPPFWATWWFRAIFFLTIAGLLGGAIRYIAVRKLQRRVRALEQQHALERERLRISRDMHDEVGANLTEIAILSELVKRDIEKPKEAEPNVQKISEKARELIDNIGEIIWAINPKNDKLDNLTTYIREFTSEYLEMTPINCRFDFPTEIPSHQISAEVRRNIFLSMKEAIHNAVKHSGATLVELNCRVSDHEVEFSVQDNGRGFIIKSLSGQGNGLLNMKKRIEEIDGNFQIESQPGNGTKIRLTVPLR